MPDNYLNIASYLGVTGVALVNLDENKTGGDDFAGELLIYSGNVIASVASNEEIPEFPEVIREGTTDKISGVPRVSLIVANSILTLLQFQTTGRASKILWYINQAIRNLLAGVPVPPAPAI
jgi:hypothetical protein